jgi:hypothetical protein
LIQTTLLFDDFLPDPSVTGGSLHLNIASL